MTNDTESQGNTSTYTQDVRACLEARDVDLAQLEEVKAALKEAEVSDFSVKEREDDIELDTIRCLGDAKDKANSVRDR